MSYDSMPDTLVHIKRVNELLLMAVAELLHRARNHDHSKLSAPEKTIFDEMTPKLAGCTYGSDEYKQYLTEMKPALDHHYMCNSHHPEYYSDGVDGMDLFDLLEMLVDWKAAGERHKDGSILKSLEINSKRFNLSPQLVSIFTNHIMRYLLPVASRAASGEGVTITLTEENYIHDGRNNA